MLGFSQISQGLVKPPPTDTPQTRLISFTVEFFFSDENLHFIIIKRTLLARRRAKISNSLHYSVLLLRHHPLSILLHMII